MAKASGGTRSSTYKSTEEKAVQKFNEEDYKAYRKAGGRTQGYVAEILGFKGAPKLANDKEFETLKNSSDYMYITRNVAVFDDVKNSKIIDQRIEDFKKGGKFDGKGMKGDGFYFSANGKYWGDKNDKVIEAVIKKNQVADYQKVYDKWQNEVFENEKYINKFNGYKKAATRITDNFGAWATAKGYTALLSNGDEMIVLNRTKLIVKK
jgi:hypothetical protein